MTTREHKLRKKVSQYRAAVVLLPRRGSLATTLR